MKKPTKKTDKDKSLAVSTDKPHGNAKDLDWSAFDALLVSDPTKVYCCEYLGVSDTHIDNKIKEKFDMTYTEYKALKLQSVIVKMKAAAINKGMSGDIPAIKYVLSNISDWQEKREVSIDDVSDRELMEAVAKLLSDKKPE